MPAAPSPRPLHPAALAGSLLVAAAVFYVAYDGGSYGLLDRNSIAIGVWWTIALTVGLGILPLERVPRAAVLTGGLLAALAVLTLLSALWADSAENALNEFNRVVLYLGVFVLVVLASRRLTGPRWSDGIALGITAVAFVALASRFLPGLFPGSQLPVFLPTERTRLYYPLNYWNGLAVLVALGAPLLLRAAVAPGNLARRALAVAPFPALAAVVYLTSSRGGTAAAVAGVVAFLALTAHRWAAAGAVTLATLGSAAAVAVLLDRHELVNGPLDSAAAEAQGRSAAVLVLLACALTGVLYALAVRYVPRAIRVGPRVAWAVVATVVVLALAGVAAADPLQRFEEFKRPPSASLGDDPIRAHLTSASGNGRWQWWAAAVDQFRSHPVLGDGAGSYEAWWAQHGTLPGFVRDAHSLYLETLGELGIPGFLLVLAVFASGIVFGVRRLRRHDADGRTVTAALLAGFLAYALAAGVDWMWELTAVSVVGVAFLALLTGAATGVPPRRPRERSRARRRTIGTVPAVLLVAATPFVIGSQAIPLLATLKVRDSEAAVRRGDGDDALADAVAARRIQPWAASTNLQVALVQEQIGDLPAADAAIQEAIDRDGSNWRLWMTAARIETKLGEIEDARRSLRRAAELNPRSPIFAGVEPAEN